MDDKTQGATAPPRGSGSADPREELRDQLQLMGKAAGDLLEQLMKMPGTLAQIPLQVLPEETATHARNAANEGFAALRTLLDSMAHGIDEVMKSQRDRMAASGSTHTGVGDPSVPSQARAGGPHDLDPSANGSASADRNTIRLDEEP